MPAAPTNDAETPASAPQMVFNAATPNPLLASLSILPTAADTFFAEEQGHPRELWEEILHEADAIAELFARLGSI